MRTTEPNETAARFHDRVPVVLDYSDAAAWLRDAPLPDARLRLPCAEVCRRMRCCMRHYRRN